MRTKPSKFRFPAQRAGRTGEIRLGRVGSAAGDRDAEQAAADELDSFFGGLPEDPAPDVTPPAGPTRSAVLAATMRKLDPARHGAFVSASALARNVLQLATECGDFGAVADAATVATAVAAKPAPGAAAPVVAKYADGLKAVSERRIDEAAVALQLLAWIAGSLYATWFLAWAFLGHRPIESIDDPGRSQFKSGTPESQSRRLAAPTPGADRSVSHRQRSRCH